MGLIKALAGSVIGTALETWKDYFVCDALDNETLMVKGIKRGGSGSNEIITNGSGIVVNDGQCAIVVEDGTIIEVAAEPGNYTFDTSISPSVFDGGFEGIKNAFFDALGRFTYGGEVNKSQRVYYINTKEIMGNMFGTATPIPFKIVDRNINLDVDVSARCNGEYSFKIVNPVTFYKNVVGNTRDRFEKEEIASMMKAEMMNTLNVAFSEVSSKNLRVSDLPAQTEELSAALNNALNQKWTEGRGIAFCNIAFNSITIPEEDQRKISELQMIAVNRDKGMADATIISAIKDAANNEGGATVGFMNLNSAANTVAGILNNNQSAAPQGATAFCPHCGAAVSPEDKFCRNCGKPLQ
ncbi:MAG: SPFH domain-containing protein [Erysipelotrichaceae bacterium]|nr:SPFH domain-containing protein [Erysipelotrichaceae bacterium]